MDGWLTSCVSSILTLLGVVISDVDGFKFCAIVRGAKLRL